MRNECRHSYTSVGTVCSSSLFGGLVNLDVLDDQVAGIETFSVGVCLSVLEETEKELSGLDWPSGSGDTESLAYRQPVNTCLRLISTTLAQRSRTLCSATSSSSVSSHRDGLLVFLDILQKLDRTL